MLYHYFITSAFFILFLSGQLIGQPKAEDAQALIKTGLKWHGKREWDKAIDCFTQVLNMDPKNSRAFYLRGCCYAEKGDLKKARENFTETIRLDPRNWLAVRARGSS